MSIADGVGWQTTLVSVEAMRAFVSRSESLGGRHGDAGLADPRREPAYPQRDELPVPARRPRAR
jgi:hypothetical protein